MKASRDTSCVTLRVSGFTLIELMVSMAILALLVVMLSSVFNVTAEAWTKSEGGSERRRSGRSLTDFIGSELRGALLPVEAAAPVTGGSGADAGKPIADLQLVVNPNQLGSDFRNADAIFWQAPLATEKTFGDIAEIGYFVRWIQRGVDQVPTLCRFFVNPSITNPGSTQPARNPLFQIYGSTQSQKGFIDINAWLSAKTLTDAAPADKTNAYRGLFAENVLGMWVRCYGTDNVELPRNYSSRVFSNEVPALMSTGLPIRDGLLNSGYVVASGSGASVYKEPRYLPAMIRVSIAQLDTRTAQLLAGAVSQVRALTDTTTIRDAGEFLAEARAKADASPAIRAILPGIRIYSTDVPLENAR